jgi:hypothetical protein
MEEENKVDLIIHKQPTGECTLEAQTPEGAHFIQYYFQIDTRGVDWYIQKAWDFGCICQVNEIAAVE